MKKIMAAVCFLLLGACGLNAEDAASDTETNQTKTGEERSSTDNPKKDEKEAPQKKESEKKAEDKKNDEKQTEEEKENASPLYEVNPADSSLDPVNKEADPKKVLVTIDDAPDTYSVKMAKTLSKEGVPAVFFVNGHFLNDQQGKEKLKKIADMGFEIGNHTMTHANVSELSSAELKQEIGALNKKIEDVTGETPEFFRAPFGDNSEKSKAFIKDQGMTWMNWSYGYDWNAKYQNAKALTDIMVNTKLLGNGSNLLMHDREWTKEALDDIIKGLREKGYGFIDPDHIKNSAT
ncbi:polysaccharide deacetylase family protein [Salibacterium halotolerans]|uniref:Peptidoglycan/xylan/chitin deacetylase, PgdA/CDA1 family n=1 Tax=Salibacterium halotolerans TaxID=1884432 RepID=A0A1I5LYX0_9BACI|nr:polysaccharide deacetylase family protein [Salibacterium halotolerans]SFP02529.1 Peptidoglycan/xylan/chitin deacetylase, PgdA/CDA1 family [Salibacterium halotolerans]